MSDYQNEQRPPEDILGFQGGTSNPDSPNDAYIPPESDAGYPSPQQDYQSTQQGDYPPQQGYPGYPPPSWDHQEYQHTESSTIEKVFKVIGIILLIITAVVAFAVVGCFALIFVPW